MYEVPARHRDELTLRLNSPELVERPTARCFDSGAANAGVEVMAVTG